MGEQCLRVTSHGVLCQRHVSDQLKTTTQNDKHEHRDMSLSHGHGKLSESRSPESWGDKRLRVTSHGALCYVSESRSPCTPAPLPREFLLHLTQPCSRRTRETQRARESMWHKWHDSYIYDMPQIWHTQGSMLCVVIHLCGCAWEHTHSPTHTPHYKHVS